MRANPTFDSRPVELPDVHALESLDFGHKRIAFRPSDVQFCEKRIELPAAAIARARLVIPKLDRLKFLTQLL
jgi:hypothetical protein